MKSLNFKFFGEVKDYIKTIFLTGAWTSVQVVNPKIWCSPTGAKETVQQLKNSFGCGTLVPPKSPKFRGLLGEAEASHPSCCTVSKVPLPRKFFNYCTTSKEPNPKRFLAITNLFSLSGNFKYMDLVEQLGSGIHRILRYYDKSVVTISEHFLEISFPFEEDNLKTDLVGEII